MKLSDVLDMAVFFLPYVLEFSALLRCTDRPIVNVMKSNPTRRVGRNQISTG